MDNLIIIGAGIVGLSNALAASKRGWNVKIFDRSPTPQGATIQNFGMVWPIGQPAGERLDIALESREIWAEIANKADLPLRPSGSIFLAIEKDELELMRQCVDSSANSKADLTFLNKDQALALSPIANRQNVVGGMLSTTEANTDPRLAAAKIAQYLNTLPNVEIHFNTPVTTLNKNQITTTNGETHTADRILICQGNDTQHLSPHSLTEHPELIPCKLHMLRTTPIDHDMGPMIASALTLRHYEAFRHLPAFQAYDQRIASTKPEIDQFGVHVMISQSSEGHLILGDSHQYGPQANQSTSEEIDDIILRELRLIATLPEKIDHRWTGTYLKRPAHLSIIKDISPSTRIVNGLGGHGMTMSFGMSERMWQNWNDPSLLSGVKHTA